MLEALTVKENYSLDQTIAKDIFNGVTYPWEVLPKISSFILELGATLSEDEYEKRGENVWVAKSAKVAPTAFINGPAIIRSCIMGRYGRLCPTEWCTYSSIR